MRFILFSLVVALAISDTVRCAGRLRRPSRPVSARSDSPAAPAPAPAPAPQSPVAVPVLRKGVSAAVAQLRDKFTGVGAGAKKGLASAAVMTAAMVGADQIGKAIDGGQKPVVATAAPTTVTTPEPQRTSEEDGKAEDLEQYRAPIYQSPPTSPVPAIAHQDTQSGWRLGLEICGGLGGLCLLAFGLKLIFCRKSECLNFLSGWVACLCLPTCLSISFFLHLVACLCTWVSNRLWVCLDLSRPVCLAALDLRIFLGSLFVYFGNTLLSCTREGVNPATLSN